MKHCFIFLLFGILLFFIEGGLSKENSFTQNIYSLSNKNVAFESANTSSFKHSPRSVLLHLRSDSLIWSEDFETDASDWHSVDETSIPSFWHLDEWNAFEGSGFSWWMADTNLGTSGGYENEWYQVLDTDTISLVGKANPSLTFQHRYSSESTLGAEAPYNGWDGMNVRVSVDTGKTWIILQNPDPAYTATSLYSFGHEHNEGTNIPGWAGNQLNWTAVSIDLSAYVNQLIQIRFAFASDGGASTSDGSGNPSWFGWQLDDILVVSGGETLYSNNGVAEKITTSSNVPIGGDLWHVKTGVGSSGDKFADCNDPNTNTYYPNMNNSFISPYFWLPDTVEQIFLDFAIQGTFSDNDVFPAVDFWGAYVQVKGETAWRYISNITLDPNGDNFVFSDAPEAWSWFSNTYSTGLTNLSSLIGDSIRVKFTFESDVDEPNGTALQVDDVIIWTPPTNLIAPSNVQATAGNGYVDLSWDEMNVSGHKRLIYDDGSFEDGIFTQDSIFDAGVLFNIITQAKIDTIWIWGFENNTGTVTTLKIWEVINGFIQNTPLFSKEISITNNIWNSIDLTADNWMVSGDFVASIEAGTFPSSAVIYIPLDGSTVPSKHSVVNLGGWSTWTSTAAGANLDDGEWGIRAAITFTQPTNITYNVYRRMEGEASFGSALVSGLPTAMYQDSDVTNGESYCYAISATHPGEGESSFSELVCATPQSASIHELAYDDGVAEIFFAMGINNYTAVKFVPDVWPQDIVKIKAFFKEGTGAVHFKIWDDDGVGGLPATELSSVYLGNVQTGWNEVNISGITITEGNFYAGLRITDTTPDLGIDDTAPVDGMSYLRSGTVGNWESFTTLGLGDAMIRCQLDKENAVGIAEVNPQIIDKFQLFQNYPNPFNPETVISFTIPTENGGEEVSLRIFDILGKEVITLLTHRLRSGLHQVLWNGKNLLGEDVTSGIYFYSLQTGKNIQTRKLVLMR
jgi:hypothetical protein